MKIIIEIKDKKEKGWKKWGWEQEYKGKKYGSYTNYHDEPVSELLAFANERWNECKNLIDK